MARQTETTLRATRLTDLQVHLAELAFARLENDVELTRAVDDYVPSVEWRAAGLLWQQHNSPRAKFPLPTSWQYPSAMLGGLVEL